MTHVLIVIILDAVHFLRYINRLKQHALINNIINSVLTSKKTQHFTTTKINWLMLFGEIITVYFENHTKPINKFCGQNAELIIAKAGGTCS
jgi:hypothetical protein